jgi:hypothetical protein
VTVGHTVTPRSAGLNGNRELKGMLANPKWMRRHINEGTVDETNLLSGETVEMTYGLLYDRGRGIDHEGAGGA